VTAWRSGNGAGRINEVTSSPVSMGMDDPLRTGKPLGMQAATQTNSASYPTRDGK